MEKAKNLVAIPYFSRWSDLIDWDVLWVEASKDQIGTSLSELAHAIDCSHTLLR